MRSIPVSQQVERLNDVTPVASERHEEANWGVIDNNFKHERQQLARRVTSP